AALEFDQGRHECGCADLEGLARPRPTVRGARRIKDARHAGDAPDWAEQADERGDVVRPHIEERAAAGLVEEPRIWMPVLGAATEHESRSCQRFTEFALADEAKTGLDSRPQKSVWRAPDLEAVGRCRVQDAATVVTRGGQRLFAEHMLAGAKGRQADLRM